MEGDICTRVGNNLKRLRKSRSQEEFSGLIGCSRKHYISVEKGHVELGIKKLEQIAKALDISVCDLVR